MKFQKLMLGLLAGAMFASCSDDLGNSTKGPGNETIGSTGFISVAIGLPTESATRGENDNFDDGSSNEWTVSNAAILFFEGELPNPKFVKAYRVVTGDADDDYDSNKELDYNQLTASIAATFPVDFAKESNAPLYALAVVNYSNVLSVTQDEKGNTTVSIFDENKKPVVFAKDRTFPEFMQQTTKRKLMGDGNTNFFMTNAPFSRVPGGTVKPVFNEVDNSFQVLAEVQRDKIFETAQQAKDNPAAEIFVERAVAKVQVKYADNVTNNDVANKLGVRVEDITWMIDNTEPSSFIVRNLQTVGDSYLPNATPFWADYISEKSSNYRFLGSVPLKDLSRFRTYYCVNPDGKNGNGYNYNDYFDENGESKAPSPMLNVQNGNNVNSYGPITTYAENTNDEITNAQYCYENTFDVEHMDYFNTTRAIIKVKFQGIGSGDNKNRPFYTVGLDQSTRYIYDDAASILTRAILENPNTRDAWESYFATKYPEGIPADVNHVATTADMVYNSDAETGGTAKNAWMEVAFSNEIGKLCVTDIKLFDGAGNQVDVDANDITTITDAVNEEHIIKCYKNSEGYFAVRIKHFGDTYTKWDEPQKDDKPINTDNTDDSYNWKADKDAAANNFLGRHGVVRNNWYVIEIQNITSFGAPTAADLPLDTTPDDKTVIEDAIACRINILSWAKRVQEEEL